MGGFENIIVPCVGKGIEWGILFLMELSGMQLYCTGQSGPSCQTPWDIFLNGAQ